MVSSAMKLKLGGLQVVAEHTRKINIKTVCPRSLCVIRYLVFFYIQAQIAVDSVTYTPDEPRLFASQEKTQRPPI